MSKKPTYSKVETEIADYILANPSEKFAKIVRKFAKICETPEPTVKRWYYNAKKLVKERIQIQENTKNAVLANEAKKTIERAIKSRDELLEFYSNEIQEYIDTKKGREKAKKIGGIIIMPTFQDARSAGAEIAKIQGYYAPVKNAQTDAQGNDVQIIEVTLDI